MAEWQPTGSNTMERYIPIGSQLVNTRVDQMTTTLHQQQRYTAKKAQSLVYEQDMAGTQWTGHQSGADPDKRAKPDCVNEDELVFQMLNTDGLRGNTRHEDALLVISNLAGITSSIAKTLANGVPNEGWEEQRQEELYDKTRFIGFANTPDSHADVKGKFTTHIHGPRSHRHTDTKFVANGSYMEYYFLKNSELKESHTAPSSQSGARPVAVLRAVDPESCNILSYAYFKRSAEKVIGNIAAAYRAAVINANVKGGLAPAVAQPNASAAVKLLNDRQVLAAFDAINAHGDAAQRPVLLTTLGTDLLAASKRAVGFDKLVFDYLAALGSFKELGYTSDHDEVKDITRISKDYAKNYPGRRIFDMHVGILSTLADSQTFSDFHGPLLHAIRAFVVRRLQRIQGLARNDAAPNTNFLFEHRPWC